MAVLNRLTAFAAAGVIAVSAALLVAPAASAALALGGGAGIIVDGHYYTLTTIGHDHTGELVGFTAAHCGGPNSQVVAEGTETTVGTVVAIANDLRLDYSVIKFDPDTVTPIASFAGFGITGVGPNPEWRQPVCKQGAATGDSCSHIYSLSAPGPNPHMSMSGGFYQPGDDGGPVTSDGLLVGMIIGGVLAGGDLLGAPQVQFTDLTKFSAILDDVNTNDGPGTGFVPIPA